jgi:phosphoribosylglycinamide formyltransferase-1
MPKGQNVILGVLASGRGSNLQAMIDATNRGELAARVGVVISNKRECLALQRARQHQIPALFIDPSSYPDRNAYDAALAQSLKAHQVELVVLAGYMRLVTPMLIELYRNRIINIHPSLLPAFPGLHAHRQAITYGVKVSGCTVHFVDEQVDHGPIIAQVAVPVLDGDTEEHLSERILAEEHRLLPQVLQLYVEGRLKIEGRQVYVEREILAEGTG